VSLPIKARLTLWYVVLFALIAGVGSVFVVVLVRADLYSDIDRALGTRASQIAQTVSGSRASEFESISEATLTGVARTEAVAQIISPSGSVLEHSGDVLADGPIVGTEMLRAVKSAGRVQLTTVRQNAETFRILVAQMPGSDRFMLVGQSTEYADAAVGKLVLALLLTGPLVLLAAGGGGWFFARRALRPVVRTTKAAASIGIDRLDERVPVPHSSDELSALAQTLNTMLDRLETGVREKHRLIADASHELQTPLAIMRAELDVSLASDSLPESAVEVLESTREEADRMTRIVRNLLVLARFDEGVLQLMRKPVDLRTASEAAVVSLGQLAAQRGVSVAVVGDQVSMSADAEYFQMVVLNLLENAIKYSGSGATVVLSTGSDDGGAFLTVADTGPGIPSDAAAHIFDRFFRIDGSRATSTGGSGLGLAISKEIVESHGGHIALESEPGRGARFTVWLPASRPPRETRTNKPTSPRLS
jgi:signal transduction histidine kinase